MYEEIASRFDLTTSPSNKKATLENTLTRYFI